MTPTPTHSDRDAFLQRIDWPAARLHAYRADALRHLLVFAQQHSPWHRDRLQGFDVASATPADLARLPPMTKADLLEHFDRIVTDPAVSYSRCLRFLEAPDQQDGRLDGRYRVSVSGGSSGVAAMTVLSDAEAALQVAALGRMLERWNARSAAWHGPPSFVSITSIKPVYRAQHIINPTSGWREAAISIEQPLAEIAERINQLQPDILSTYPSLLPRLIAATQSDLLVARPKLVLAVAEPLLPEHQRRAEQVWGCPVLSGWGATEVGAIAMGTGFDQGMLLLDDLVIVELVDRDYRPVAPGQRCDRVLVTALHRQTLPMIRYEYTDQLALEPHPACCGSAFRLASLVEGRLEDHFVYPGGHMVDARLFREALAAEPAILEYQVRQTASGAEVLITQDGPLDTGRLHRVLQAGLRASLGAGASITIRPVATIARTQGAQKLRRFVPAELPASGG